MPKFLFLPFVPSAPSRAPAPGEQPAHAPAPVRRPARRLPLPRPYDFIGNLRTAEGATLRYGLACPQGPRRGSVLLLQGRAECLEKYREIVPELSARGLMVYSFDWHGQGLSDRLLRRRRPAEVRSFEDYLEDLDLFIREVWCRPEPHRFIIAHSTGGHVALRYLAERGLKVAGAVLCAPMIDLRPHGWPRWFAPLLAGACVGLGLGDCQIPGEERHLPSRRQFEGNLLTSDPARFRILPDLVAAHPGLERRGATYRWAYAAFRSIARLHRPGLAESIDSPITVLAGAEDRLVDTEAARRFAARLPRGRFIRIEGARHEIMMENDRVLAEFWQAVDRMLEEAEAPENRPSSGTVRFLDRQVP